MKKFSPAEIQGTRDYFSGKGFPVVSATVLGHTFSYFVLPPSLETKLPDFVFRCTGDPDRE